MILPGGRYHVYLATRPVDFRKGHTGLSLVIQTVLGRDPFSGAVFVFRSKRGDRIKILVWDQTGLVLVYKHLEGGQELCLNLGDAHSQAARFSVSVVTSTPSLNLIPSMTFGN